MFPVNQSGGDQNKYELFELENGLQVLLIEDNNQQASTGEAMAYVALSVNIGSFNNPTNRQGLAHFLEHMIFMGSEKFPEESTYSNYIASNGGWNNAYTAFEWTNFQYEVAYSGFKKSLDILADSMKAPLLNKDAMERELEAVESEYKMFYGDDDTRTLQILQSETVYADHIMHCFDCGNKKSLKGDGDYQSLQDDLKKLYDEQYSADRMRLVIQVKTKDEMKEVRSWVEQYFSSIPNKNLGKQDFSKMSNTGPNSEACGTMPWRGNEHEIILRDSFNDRNFMFLGWTLPIDQARFEKKSASLIMGLLGHQGEGGLFQCLKKLNFVSGIETGIETTINSPFRLFMLMFNLTDDGILNYQKILAIIFEYIRIVKEQWIANGKALDVWIESKTISNLSYDVYTVPQQDENVCSIADTMIYVSDLSNLIKEVYSKPIIDEIDMDDIKLLFDELRYDRCKMSLDGNDLFKKADDQEIQVEFIGNVKKEENYGTKYRLFKKADEQALRQEFTDDEWKTATSMFKKPPKNRFVPDVPEGLQILAKEEEGPNANPKEIVLSEKHTLYHVLDHVYRKPTTTIHCILRIQHPEVRQNENGKPLSFLRTAKDVAMFNVMENCLDSTMNERIRYEAELADIEVQFSAVDEVTVDFVIKGFSQKIFNFAETFIDILLECSETEFEQSEVMNSVETKMAEIGNMNSDVVDHATNNRFLFILPHEFHNDLIVKELNEMLDEDAQEEITPHKFLKDKILSQISSVQVLVVGNTSEKQAVKFCKENIVKKFKTVTNNNIAQLQTKVGYLHKGDELNSQQEDIAPEAYNTILNENADQDNMKETFQAYQQGIQSQIIWDCLKNEDEGEEDGEEDGEEECEEDGKEDCEEDGKEDGEEDCEEENEADGQENDQAKDDLFDQNAGTKKSQGSQSSKNDLKRGLSQIVLSKFSRCLKQKMGPKKDQMMPKNFKMKDAKNKTEAAVFNKFSSLIRSHSNSVLTEDVVKMSKLVPEDDVFRALRDLHMQESLKNEESDENQVAKDCSDPEEEDIKTEEEEQEEEEEEEETEDNSAIEIYFQPDNQNAENAIAINSMLLVLETVMAEKMYYELRTKDQLGYLVAVYKKNTCGIAGLSFVIQSATKSPIYLQKRILDFIDTFYNDIYTEELFNKWKKGTLEFVKKSYADLAAESSDRCNQLKNLTIGQIGEIDWNVKDKEIDFIVNHCTYSTMRDFYKNLLNPTVSKKPFASDAGNPANDATVDKFRKYLESKKDLRDLLKIEDGKIEFSVDLEDVNSFESHEQKRFLAIRIFAKKWQEEMQSENNTLMEYLATHGQMLPIPSLSTVYLPKLRPRDNLTNLRNKTSYGHTGELNDSAVQELKRKLIALNQQLRDKSDAIAIKENLLFAAEQEKNDVIEESKAMQRSLVAKTAELEKCNRHIKNQNKIILKKNAGLDMAIRSAKEQEGLTELMIKESFKKALAERCSPRKKSSYSTNTPQKQGGSLAERLGMMPNKPSSRAETHTSQSRQQMSSRQRMCTEESSR